MEETNEMSDHTPGHTTRFPFRTLPLRLGLTLAVTSLAVTAVALEAGSPAPASDTPANAATAAFERLKALEGEWRGTNNKGAPVTLSYEPVSGGTAVLERERMTGHPDMLTLFHVDGERLVLTHYCVGNQPRMVARPDGIDGGRMEFDVVDVTGLESPEEGHMRRAVFELPDDDHLRSAWTWRQDGEDAFTVVVEAERVHGGAGRPAAGR